MASGPSFFLEPFRRLDFFSETWAEGATGTGCFFIADLSGTDSAGNWYVLRDFVVLGGRSEVFAS